MFLKVLAGLFVFSFSSLRTSSTSE